jgi:hypothetical protein
MTRYRTSCHTLEIEIGRRNNITREENVCKVCIQNSNIYVIEDEFHMLCVCPLYSELRVAYGIKCRDIVSSCSMLASQNENYVNNLAAFIYNAFKLRNTYLQVWLVFDCESKSWSVLWCYHLWCVYCVHFSVNVFACIYGAFELFDVLYWYCGPVAFYTWNKTLKLELKPVCYICSRSMCARAIVCLREHFKYLAMSLKCVWNHMQFCAWLCHYLGALSTTINNWKLMAHYC